VIVVGRADKSFFMQLPNHRIDVSMNEGRLGDNMRPISDQESGKASKLENPESLPVPP
jgi:hypothetical protein